MDSHGTLEAIVNTICANVAACDLVQQVEVHAVAANNKRLAAPAPLGVLDSHRRPHRRYTVHAELRGQTAIVALYDYIAR